VAALFSGGNRNNGDHAPAPKQKYSSNQAREPAQAPTGGALANFTSMGSSKPLPKGVGFQNKTAGVASHKNAGDNSYFDESDLAAQAQAKNKGQLAQFFSNKMLRLNSKQEDKSRQAHLAHAAEYGGAPEPRSTQLHSSFTKTFGISKKKQGQRQVEQESEQLRAEVEGLRFKVQELQEEKMQLKNNLQLNKQIIQSLVSGEKTLDSFVPLNQSQPDILNPNLTASIKDQLIVQKFAGHNAPSQALPPAQPFAPGPPPALKPPFFNLKGPMKVPQLNLANLKHVKEYAFQNSTTLYEPGAGLAVDQAAPKKNATPAPPPKMNQEQNQWYHYSTKLEANIRQLREQIDSMELKFAEVKEQMEAETKQKDKLQVLNLKLSSMVKQLKQQLAFASKAHQASGRGPPSAQSKPGQPSNFSGMPSTSQFNTFDGRQQIPKGPSQQQPGG